MQNLAGCGHHGAAGAEQITPMFVNWTDVPSLNCDFFKLSFPTKPEDDFPNLLQ